MVSKFKHQKTTEQQGLEKDNSRNRRIIDDYVAGIIPILILFVTYFGVTLRQIQTILDYIFDQQWSINHIQKVKAKVAVKVRDQNDQMDQRVAEKIKYLSLDTSWKGQASKVFAAICKQSGYLFRLKFVKSESEKELTPLIIDLRNSLSNLKVLVTDFAKAWFKVIRKECSNVVHKLCNIHAIRILLRRMQKLLKETKRQKKVILALKEKRQLKRDWIDKGQKTLKNLRSKLHRVIHRRKQMYVSAGLVVNLDGTLKSKRKGVPPKIKQYTKEKVGPTQVNRSASKKRLNKHKEELELLDELFNQELKACKKPNKQVSDCKRYIRQFYNILTIKNSKDQQKELRFFMKNLNRSGNIVAKEILKMIKKYPELFTTADIEDLESKHGNTNDVENLFSQLRIRLDIWRRLQDTPGNRDNLDIFRFCHNFLGPTSGIHRFQTPIARLGVQIDLKKILSNIIE